jgi:hypothetical protein
MADENNNIPTQPRACPKDCRQCSMQQQIYCSTHLTFNLYEVMSKMSERLDVIEDSIVAMQQESDGDFLTPDAPEISE